MVGGLLILLSCNTWVNPFLLDIPSSKAEEIERVEEVQNLLRQKEVRQELEKIYPRSLIRGGKYKPFEDFYRRAMRGIEQRLIDREQGYLPQKRLRILNGGGPDCIVLSCPFNRNYPELMESLIQALEEIGFRGAVYYRIGGFPNPTGEEVRYVAVPYSFKIFMMLEAQQLGFQNVLWLDSAVYPIKNPEGLFRFLENQGAVITWKKFRRNALLPSTEALLHEMTGYKPTGFQHVSMQVFGLRMDLPWVAKFIEDYYEMVRLGTPFLSCYPEEHVISALLYKYREHLPAPYSKLILSWSADSTHFIQACREGYTFYLRGH